MKIAVVGSRDYPALEDVGLVLDDIYKITNNKVSIITGGARGVDKEAERWAQARGVKCEVIRPVNPSKKIDYLFRNVEIITKAHYVVAFHHKNSKGTAFVIEYALARNIPLRVIG